MSQLTRFGRRVPLPSTVQIVHELLVAQQNDNAQTSNAGEDAADKPAPAFEEIRVPSPVK
jgi:hypothetical protein